MSGIICNRPCSEDQYRGDEWALNLCWLPGSINKMNKLWPCAVCKGQQTERKCGGHWYRAKLQSLISWSCTWRFCQFFFAFLACSIKNDTTYRKNSCIFMLLKSRGIRQPVSLVDESSFKFLSTFQIRQLASFDHICMTNLKLLTILMVHSF